MKLGAWTRELGVAGYDIKYSKKLPFYLLLQLSRAGLLLGLVMFVSYLVLQGRSHSGIVLAISGVLLLVSSIGYRGIIFMREEKYFFGRKDRDLFSLKGKK